MIAAAAVAAALVVAASSECAAPADLDPSDPVAASVAISDAPPDLEIILVAPIVDLPVPGAFGDDGRVRVVIGAVDAEAAASAQDNCPTADNGEDQ